MLFPWHYELIILDLIPCRIIPFVFPQALSLSDVIIFSLKTGNFPEVFYKLSWLLNIISEYLKRFYLKMDLILQLWNLFYSYAHKCHFFISCNDDMVMTSSCQNDDAVMTSKTNNSYVIIFLLLKNNYLTSFERYSLF